MDLIAQLECDGGGVEDWPCMLLFFGERMAHSSRQAFQVQAMIWGMQ